ncbi:MAG: RNA polymerase sigma factor [Candidatus Sumerlaeia bacterium]|nr:RNA polymerase sigma factor [Candidatus Sumerlaeia bacterium]
MDDTTRIGDEALCRQACAGDREAFDALVARHYRTVWLVGVSRLDEDAAEDLAQEVFLRAWLNLGGLRSGALFGGWVARMARNLAVQWRRQGTRRSRLVQQLESEVAHMVENIPDGQPTAAEAMASAEDRRRVRGAMERLDGETRELVLLHYVERLSHSEIARRTGVHHTTVGRRLEKARAELRHEWDALERLGPAAWTPRAAALPGALGVVGLASALPPAAARNLAAAAAATAPREGAGALASTAVGFLQSHAAIAASGVAAMGTAKVVAGTAIIAGLAGVLYFAAAPDQPPGPAAAPATAAAAPAPPGAPQEQVIQTTVGMESAFALPVGQQVRLLTAVEHPVVKELRLKAVDAGTVEASAHGHGGEVESHVFAVADLPFGERTLASFHFWPERRLCAVFAYALRRSAAGGPEVLVFSANRPDLLPEFEQVSSDFKAGRIDRAASQSRRLALLEKNGMMPRDPELRALVLAKITESR